MTSLLASFAREEINASARASTLSYQLEFWLTCYRKRHCTGVAVWPERWLLLFDAVCSSLFCCMKERNRDNTFFFSPFLPLLPLIHIFSALLGSVTSPGFQIRIGLKDLGHISQSFPCLFDVSFATYNDAKITTTIFSLGIKWELHKILTKKFDNETVFPDECFFLDCLWLLLYKKVMIYVTETFFKRMY